MNLIHLFNTNHTSTKRNYLERMSNNKIHSMNIASKYDEEYWDGDRSTGYGGYHYDGRYRQIAEEIVKRYGLTSKSKVLDFGCGKGYLLFEIYNITKCQILGLDISDYAIKNSKAEIKEFIKFGDEDALEGFSDNEFDLVISTMTLHNLSLRKLDQAITSIERIGKTSLLTVESYRNSNELFNLQCWALTCKIFLSPDDWRYIFDRNKYTGDVEFLYFE
ncbi:class I SAM-dependent methyltransferase [Bacteriovorax sp. Seq25_V]|uniref:class I SAM-dependent methyltransferase n=1 Tax=Bacteriovorax sp. Seq25_V TaxID=1201288 RepID=UPI00038A00B4|nr:class I SAM-dependent methyltransferase [Bacteriovorax sp. Seq25_V]EQC46804.1 methionine biosynthesis protein MetW-like protein [Bacteriovorax sp. Seq25_V]